MVGRGLWWGRSIFFRTSGVSKQRNGGLYHLQDVMKGKFGEVPAKGIK